MIDIVLFGAIVAIPTLLALSLIDTLGTTWNRQRSEACSEASAGTLPGCNAKSPAILSDCGEPGRVQPNTTRQPRLQPVGGVGAAPIAFPAPEVRLEA